MVDELRFAGASFFLILFLTRLAQLLISFFATSAIFLKKEISEDFLSLYILFLIAVGAGFSLFESNELVGRLSINAFFYLLLAASFTGSIKDWLQIYLPVASFLLFAPIGLKASHLFHLQNLSFVIASFICSNGIVFVRQFVRHNPSSKKNDSVMPDMNFKISKNEISEEFFLRTEEENQEVRDFFSVEMFGCKDLMALISETVLDKKNRFKNFPRTEIMIVGPRSTPIGWGIQTDPLELKSMLSQLIEESAGSLGMQTGFVRISVQFTLKQMHLIVEDNGRGLEKDALMKLEQKGLLAAEEITHASQTSIEMRSLLKFWGADFEFATRLGVGRRVCMSFPLKIFEREEVTAIFDNYNSFASNEATVSH